MGFSMQEYWSGLPFLTPGDLPNPGIEPASLRFSLALAGGVFITSVTWEAPRRSKALPKAKLAPKIGHGHCLVVCCTSNSLQLSESGEIITCEKYGQQIDEMHWKLQRLQPALVNIKGPILLHDNAQLHLAQPTFASKVKQMDYGVLPHLPCSPDLLPNNYHFFKHLDNFCRENASITSKRQRMLSKSSLAPEAWIFTL